MVPLAATFGSGRRVFQIFLETPTVASAPDARPFDGRHQSIQFHDVDFSYASRPDHIVLHRLSFAARRGELTALVGESGAGKSTVAALLLRHYDVTGGQITINGVDLKEWKVEDLREQIAVVPQDIVIFGRTLRENIAYGKLDATEAELRPRPGPPTRGNSFNGHRRVWIPSPVNAESPSPEANGNGSPSPAPFSRTRDPHSG